MALFNLNTSPAPQLPGQLPELPQMLSAFAPMRGPIGSTPAPPMDQVQMPQMQTPDAASVLAALRSQAQAAQQSMAPRAGAPSLAQAMNTASKIPATIQSSANRLPGQIAPLPAQLVATLGGIPNDVHSALQSLMGLLGISSPTPPQNSQPKTGLLGVPQMAGTPY